MIDRIIRARFKLTSHRAACRNFRREADRTLKILNSVEPEFRNHEVTVPKMLGVDEDMRGWSLLMILEHNHIVNLRVTGVIRHLLDGDPMSGTFDPKRDVMPSSSPQPSLEQEFEDLIQSHLDYVKDRQDLRKTEKRDHPLFGPFPAHSWNCMLGFHLYLHRKQAEAVVRELPSNT